MIIVLYRKVFFAIAIGLTVLGIVAIAIFGIRLGIDFTGGALAEVRYEGTQPNVVALQQSLQNAGIEGSSVRIFGENSYLIRMPTLTEAQKASFPTVVAVSGATSSVENFNEVGPTIGAELRAKALVAIVLVTLAIALYIAFIFRKVSKPVSSWWYGLIAILALGHDIIMPAGALALMGYLFGTQADALFVTALLAILGFSIHDTIVTFDRVRENLRLNEARNVKEEFSITVGKAIDQTLTRSLNTSMTTLISLVVLFFLGPVSTQDFTLILIVGIIAGTFSSICLAAPLLVAVERWQAGKVS